MNIGIFRVVEVIVINCVVVRIRLQVDASFVVRNCVVGDDVVATVQVDAIPVVQDDVVCDCDIVARVRGIEVRAIDVDAIPVVRDDVVCDDVVARVTQVDAVEAVVRDGVACDCVVVRMKQADVAGCVIRDDVIA